MKQKASDTFNNSEIKKRVTIIEDNKKQHQVSKASDKVKSSSHSLSRDTAEIDLGKTNVKISMANARLGKRRPR